MVPKSVFLLFALFASCLAGELTILNAPDSVRFGQASALRMSSLDDMLAAAMGYTPEASSGAWTGLTVTSPFNSPTSVVVIAVDGSGSDILQEGTRYPLQEDQPLLKVYGNLHSSVSARAQRPTHFQHMEVADGVSENYEAATLPKDSALQASRQPDAVFLLEVNALPLLVSQLEKDSSVSHGGQDFIFYQIESFALLVKTYGDDSPEVHQGKRMLRDAIGRLTAEVRTLYNDQVLVVSAVLDKPTHIVSRNTRSVLQTEPTLNLNLAKEYSEDYPAIFNIVLILSIVLLLAVLASSMSMAYMDPGRDSIIYRMSNPRMKKDQ